jgi:hypothetical protein
MTTALDQPAPEPLADDAPRAPGGADWSTGVSLVQCVVAALLVGAGAVHLAMAPSHFGESTTEGVGFLVAAWLQIGLAVGILLRPSRGVVVGTILASAGSIVAWIVSRTVGLPFGVHSGHAESVTIVDGVTVAMEAATIVLAAMLLSPSVRRFRSNPAAIVGIVAVLVLTSSILASPAARDHAAHAHGSHAHSEATASESGDAPHTHDHSAGAAPAAGTQSIRTHGHESDIMYAELPAKTKAEVDQVIAAYAHKYPTAADATKDGWVKASLSFYGIGAHYTHGIGIPATPTFELLNPNMLLYDGEGPDAKFAGVSYSVSSATKPEGFTGPYDVWHSHGTACTKGGTIVSLTEDNSDVWLSEGECTARGGRVFPIPGDLMIHVWIGPGYLGKAPIFAHDHPMLFDGFVPQRDA